MVGVAELYRPATTFAENCGDMWPIYVFSFQRSLNRYRKQVCVKKPEKGHSAPELWNPRTTPAVVPRWAGEIVNGKWP